MRASLALAACFLVAAASAQTPGTQGLRTMKTLEYLKAKGIEPVWGPVFREKYARAEIRDPNGYPIELRQWNP